MKRFTFLKALFSPFKPFGLGWYCGKIAIGTPYFLPRRWVKNKNDNGRHAVRRKFGFDIVDLGWKTKYEDFRFEWSPLISFVFFKWQIAVFTKTPWDDQYWEAWLHYEYRTDKKASRKERVADCRKNAPSTWSRYIKDEKVMTDYYDLILKKRYR